MRSLFLILSIALSVLLELVSPLSIGGVAFPFAASAAFFWFRRISFSSRLILAVLLGFVFEIFRTFPPGTYLIAFLVEAFLTDAIKSFLSDTRRPLTEAAGLFLMLMSFSLLVVFGSLLIGKLTSEKIYWEAGLIGVLAGAFIWSAVSAALLAGISNLLRK